jgi:general secretion pathway protein K
MTNHRTAGQRGFALMVVLLAVGLLSLLTLGLLADGRSALATARALRDATAADAAAQGAIDQAIFQLRRGAWEADGRTRMFRIGQAAVAVTARDEYGRINPNQTSASLLTALLMNAGAHPAQASDVAAALVDWRTTTPRSIAGGQKLDRYLRANLPYGPPGRPFASIDELAEVPGMTGALLADVRGHLSVYEPGPSITVANDESPALQIAAVSNGLRSPDGPDTSDRVIELRAVAALPGGVTAGRKAQVHLGAALGETRDWQILTWGRSSR